MLFVYRIDVAEFVEYTRKYRPTFFSGVPTVYKILVDSHDKVQRSDVSSLEFGICGAAPMPAKWFEDFESLFGITIVEGYGLTEGTVASTVNPRFGKKKVGWIGMPLQGQDVRIFGENDSELPPGEVGEIAIRGPNVMKGYLNREAETQEVLRNGWLHSVDLAVLSMGAGRAVNMTGRQPPAYSTGDVFVIYGLVNPTLVIPAGASLNVTVVNLDDSEYHNFVVTALAPPYPYMAMEGMMTAAGQQLQGGSLGPMMPFLPPADYGRGVAHQYSYAFTLSTPPNLWYICMYPGHAQMGMYGEILVES